MKTEFNKGVNWNKTKVGGLNWNIQNLEDWIEIWLSLEGVICNLNFLYIFNYLFLNIRPQK